MVITQCPTPKLLRRNWTNVYDPTLACHDSGGEPISMHTRATASDSDVFNDIAALEDSLIEYTSTNLNGINIMATSKKLTAIADAILNADAKVHAINNQGHAYFDPLDTLEDKLGLHSYMHSQVLSSMAWAVDAACISQAKNVVFGRWGETDKEATNFNDFCQNILEELDHESLYEDGTPEHQLAQLLTLREHWHDAAAAAASADNRDYKQKSLREQIESKQPALPNIGARQNFEAIAESESGGDPVKKAQFLADCIRASELNSIQMVENDKRLLPTTMLVLQAASRYKPDTIRFDQLPVQTQQRFVQAAPKTIDRIRVQAASKFANSPIAFARMNAAAGDAVKALNDVLRTKYAAPGELENSAVHDMHNRGHNLRMRRAFANML